MARGTAGRAGGDRLSAVAGSPSRGITARGQVVLAPGRGGAPRIRSLLTAPPLGVRIAGGEVRLMGTAGGPLGGDDLALAVDVAAGTRAVVRSVAATVALPGDGRPSRSRLDVVVGAGADLAWLPEPLIAADGCDHHATAHVDVAPDAGLVWRDDLVVGRHGEAGGRIASTLRITRDGQPLLHHRIDTGLPGWRSPAVSAGARAVGLLVVVGAPATALPDHVPTGPYRVAVNRLADDVVVVVGLADDHAELDRALHAAAEDVLPA